MSSLFFAGHPVNVYLAEKDSQLGSGSGESFIKEQVELTLLKERAVSLPLKELSLYPLQQLSSSGDYPLYDHDT